MPTFVSAQLTKLTKCLLYGNSKEQMTTWSQRLGLVTWQWATNQRRLLVTRHKLTKSNTGRKQWRIQPGAGGGGMPPVGGLAFFFASILILLPSRLHTMARGNTKVAVCRRLLLSNRLVFAAFCCLFAVHCMQAAAASFVSPKAVFLACSWTAKKAFRMH